MIEPHGEAAEDGAEAAGVGFGAFFPHAEVVFEAHVEDVIADVADEGEVLGGEAEAVAFADEVAGFVHEESEDIHLVMAPVVGDGFEGGGVDAGGHEEAALVEDVGLHDGGLDDAEVVAFEDVEDEAEAFDHFVEAAEVFVGVGGEHDVADPEDIVGVAGAVVGGVRAGDVAAVGAAQAIEGGVGEADAFVERLLVEVQGRAVGGGAGAAGHGDSSQGSSFGSAKPDNFAPAGRKVIRRGRRGGRRAGPGCRRGRRGWRPRWGGRGGRRGRREYWRFR